MTEGLINEIVRLSCPDCMSIERVGINRAWGDDLWRWSDCSGSASAWTLDELYDKVKKIQTGD